MVDVEQSIETPFKAQSDNKQSAPSSGYTLQAPESEGTPIEEHPAAPTIPMSSFVALSGGVEAWSAVLGFLCQFASY